MSYRSTVEASFSTPGPGTSAPPVPGNRRGPVARLLARPSTVPYLPIREDAPGQDAEGVARLARETPRWRAGDLARLSQAAHRRCVHRLQGLARRGAVLGLG